jgi:two-component system chemotaxis sensor kinase CheA
MDMQSFRNTYFEECNERLQEIETLLLSLESGDYHDEHLHAIFRAVHSIKGGAGAFGCDHIVSFAHIFETVLDRVRDHRLVLDPKLMEILVTSADVLAAIVVATEKNNTLANDFDAKARTALCQYVEDSDTTAKSATAHAAETKKGAERTYTLVFKPHTRLYEKANEPLLLLRELGSLGEMSLSVNVDAMPDLSVMDAAGGYLCWTITLQTTHEKDALTEVFEFVLDDCDLSITETAKTVAGEVKPKTPSEVSPAAASAGDGTESKASSIRVDVDKIDRLVNMVGELVITHAMLSQQAEKLTRDGYPHLARGIEELSTNTRELQDHVMAIRAQPVKIAFARIPRLVRDVSKDVNKQIKLVMTGEETEVDKTVIENLADPLTHLIRNAVDHGIEDAATREAAGKPTEGTITLSAGHRSGRILIEIRDDGGGLNTKKIAQKAKDRGLIDNPELMSADELHQLIFHPGFSTADQVSNISGRGVGMDVVKRNIQSIGGKVYVKSEPGVGSRFTLSLPLTLAVMDGMIVRVGSQKLILPISNIVESLRPRRDDVSTITEGGEVLDLRDKYIPLLRLNRLFNIPARYQEPWEGLLLIVESEQTTFALFVDELVGKQQVVIKSLEENYDPVEGISSATILGDGSVALILDPASLYELHSKQGDALACAA